MRAKVGALSLVAAFLLTAAPSLAATEWTTPLNLSASGSLATSPVVATDSSTGVSTAVWEDGDTDVIQEVQVGANGSTGTVHNLSASGGFSQSPQVVVSSSTGVATVAWNNGGVIQEVQLNANGSAGTVHNLSGATAQGLALALDPNTGVVTAVWYQPVTYYVVQEVQITANGTPGTVQTLTANTANAVDPQVAVNPGTGVAIVIWQHNDGSEYIIQEAQISAAGTVGATHSVSATGEGAQAAQVAVSSSGVATVVWQRNNGSNEIIQEVQVSASGIVAATENLSAPGGDAMTAQVAVNGSGVATVVWGRSNGSHEVIETGPGCRQRSAGCSPRSVLGV